MKKRIDIVVKYFYPVAAGIETNIMSTYKVLVEMGWDVNIHTSKDTLTEKNVLPDEEILNNIKVKRYEFNRLGYFPKIDWANTDLVCLHNFNVLPHMWIMFMSFIKKILGQKHYALILTPHGGFNPEWSIFPKFVAFIKSLYHFTLGTLLINLSVDGVRAVSEWERDQIISKGVSKKIVVVIDNGIEDEAYLDVEKEASAEIKERISKVGRYIIQIGRIYVIKNYETTIKALTKLPADIKYLIVGPVGSNEYLEELKALIKELKLEDRVIFFGVVRGIDKYYIIKKSLMMVHMAIWESFCNVVHEGLSQGKVCIVSNNTALPYLVKNNVNGYCVETYDVNTLAEKINFVIENQESQTIKDMERVNREYGLENSWRNVASKMNDLYLNLGHKAKNETTK